MFSQASIRKDKRHVLSRLLNQATDCNLAPRKVSANSEIREIFACGIQNPGLSNSQFSSRNPESPERLEPGV